MAAGLFNITLVGGEKLIAQLERMPETVVKALRDKIERLTIDLQTHIVRDKLHGQVLGQRSGNLARSIRRRVEATGLSVFGFVFSSGDVKYAAVHEYGFEGDVTVKQHMRTMVFGKEAATAFSVGPYQRHMKMPERSFMRTGLADMRPEITTGLKEAVIAGMRLDKAL